MNTDQLDFKNLKDILWLALCFLVLRHWVQKEEHRDSDDEAVLRKNKDNSFYLGEWG